MRLVKFPQQRNPNSGAIFQDTPLCDILLYTEAVQHVIIPGDCVICRRKPASMKYVPGIVVGGRADKYGNYPLEDNAPNAKIFLENYFSF